MSSSYSTTESIDIDAEIEKAFAEAGINTEVAEELNFVTLDDDFNSTKFIGSNIDLLFGLIYIFRKHSNGCLPLSIKLTKKIDMFTQIGINWTCNNGKRELTIPPELVKNFYKCKNRNGVRFIIILLTLISKDNCGTRYEDLDDMHANVLIYDCESNEIERFEPNGCIVERKYTKSGKRNYWYQIDKFDTQFEKIAKSLFGAKYVPVKINCPFIGLQDAQDSERLTKYSDPGGFCASWTLFIIDMQLRNPSKTLTEIQLLAMKRLQKSPRSLTTFIRSFSEFIVKKRKEILSKFNKATVKKIEDDDEYIYHLPTNELKKINQIIFKELKGLKQPIVGKK